MEYNPHVYHYPSRRHVCYAKYGMVATSTPAAAQAGLEILKKGGNAIDAAVATAASLTVTEPSSNGIGGDAFAIIWHEGQMYGLNASGYAPKGISYELLREKGFTEIPKYGFEAATVPGAPSAWAALTSRFGKLTLAENLAPAVNYAANGYAVAPDTARGFAATFRNFSKTNTDEKFAEWFRVFAPNGHTPDAGQVFSNADMARTLTEIGATNAESFYRGNLMEQIVAFSKKYDGYYDESDFTEYQPEWVTPISANYRGFDVHEIPPNGHGITALLALNILKQFDLYIHRETARNYHLQIEAMKLAYADAKEYVTDPRHMTVSVEELLSEEYAKKRAALISDKALLPEPGQLRKGGTVYLCVADQFGNMVSYIQSNYMGFGSGLVVPNTGISLHNRGHNFNFDPNHDNCIAGGKKPYHTIIPGFLTKGGKPVGPFGVMGGFMQPQGHLQMVANTVDFHFNPQDALDATRWQWNGGRQVDIESTVPQHIMQELASMGHDVKLVHNYGGMGRGQIIWQTPDGTLVGGSEPRCDGQVAVW